MTDPNTPATPDPYVAPAPPAAAAQPVYSQAGDYPGKTLGIVGLVLVFFTVIVGLILSHIALAQSKKAGFTNTPAKVGVILGWIFVGIGVLITIISLIVLAVVAAAAGSR